MPFVQPVYANCPVCVVTVGGGLFLAKKLGMDDLLVSIWLSGLNTAIAFWFASKVKTKILRSSLLWTAGFYVITIIYLLTTKQIGHPGNSLWGIDKVYFGLTLGLIVFLLSYALDRMLHLKNGGKVLFYYQKVVIPVVFLFVTTIIFYFFIRK